MLAWSPERFTEREHDGVMDKERRDFVRFYFMDEIAAQQFREHWAPAARVWLRVLAAMERLPATMLADGESAQ